MYHLKEIFGSLLYHTFPCLIIDRLHFNMISPYKPNQKRFASSYCAGLFMLKKCFSNIVVGIGMNSLI